MDATRSERYPITQFAGEGFNTWAFRIKSILKECDVLQAIIEEDFSKKTTNIKYEVKAQAIIIASMADSYLEYVKQETAYDMFKNLEKCFKKKSVQSRLFIRINLSQIKYNEYKSLSDHFVRLEEMFTELKEAEDVLSEAEKVNYLLLSMPQSYEAIITALETVSDLSLNFVKTRMLAEEEKRKKSLNKNNNTHIQHTYNSGSSTWLSTDRLYRGCLFTCVKDADLRVMCVDITSSLAQNGFLYKTVFI